MRTVALLLLASLLLGSCASSSLTQSKQENSRRRSSSSAQSSSSLSSSFVRRLLLPFPVSLGEQRIAKKPFGMFITPENSPIEPERFKGYHTGTDFEIFPSELRESVPVHAVCSGSVLFTGWVKGYGGVLVQECAESGETVTVLYGHLRMASLSLSKGEAANPGQEIGLLGDDASSETDGERKHLHLAVHWGGKIDFRGYVQSKEELNQWIDPYPIF